MTVETAWWTYGRTSFSEGLLKLSFFVGFGVLFGRYGCLDVCNHMLLMQESCSG